MSQNLCDIKGLDQVDMSLKGGFELGEWEVRPLEGRITGPAGTRRLQPRGMDVLVCLADCAGEVVERDEVLSSVWGKTAVTDEPLTRCIGELRQQLGDRRKDPLYVETIRKRGYRRYASDS